MHADYYNLSSVLCVLLQQYTLSSSHVGSLQTSGSDRGIPCHSPQQHPSCCYGNNIPSSAVYSVQDPPHTSQAAWGAFGRQHGAVCFMSDQVSKIMKGDGFQNRKLCVREVNLLAPEKIMFCCANLNLLFF